jgi:pyruvate, water dikinase
MTSEGQKPRRIPATPMGGLRRLGRSLALFLEVIGLKAVAGERESHTQSTRYRQHHEAFRKLLSNNDGFLRCMAELDQKLVGNEPCDPSYPNEISRRLLGHVRKTIESLNAISDGGYQTLWVPFETIAARLLAIVSPKPRPADPELAIDLASIDYRDTELVGGKMANLGEIRNHVGLPTPDGFALTAHAYRSFVEADTVAAALADDAGVASRPDEERTSTRLMEAIHRAPVPEPIAHAILSAYDRLVTREGRACRVAVRSSALGEDGPLSFAGQHDTVLDVDRDHLVEAWRHVAASLFSSRAMHYRRMQGVSAREIAMPVGIVTMVSAKAAGVVFSRDPAGDRGKVVVQVVSGLGAALVEGSVTPVTIEVTPGEAVATVHRPGSIRPEPRAARYPDDVEPALARQQSLLSDAQALQLAGWARLLEAYFGRPQDVEWALDDRQRLCVLQARPLGLARCQKQERPPVAGAAVLVAEGEVACPGVGTGPAFQLDVDADFSGFPDGAVLVVKRPSPKFVALLRKAVAVVADSGSTTGHMASLAREFRVPTLLGTREATRVIPVGAVVTVDAVGGYAYLGDVEVPPAEASAGGKGPNQRQDTHARVLLGRAAELVVPLHLTDPRAPGFRAESCTSLHDITRYVHERAYEEMFRLGEKLGDLRSAAYYLDVFLPVDLYIIDLGGGIRAPKNERRIKLGQITSVPLEALLRGMLHPKIPRWGARPLDVRGFASVVLEHAWTSPEQESSFRDPSYALASDRYLNYTARVGYHFSIVDAYCGVTTNKNYIHLLFRGGAADSTRRGRRARAIAGILKEWGFSVEVQGDSTDGRISKTRREETARLIEYVGRLLQFMRQMDVAMTSDTALERVKDAFLHEDYAFEREDYTRPDGGR